MRSAAARYCNRNTREFVDVVLVASSCNVLRSGRQHRDGPDGDSRVQSTMRQFTPPLYVEVVAACTVPWGARLVAKWLHVAVATALEVARSDVVVFDLLSVGIEQVVPSGDIPAGADVWDVYANMRSTVAIVSLELYARSFL